MILIWASEQRFHWCMCFFRDSLQRSLRVRPNNSILEQYLRSARRWFVHRQNNARLFLCQLQIICIRRICCHRPGCFSRFKCPSPTQSPLHKRTLLLTHSISLFFSPPLSLPLPFPLPLSLSLPVPPFLSFYSSLDSPFYFSTNPEVLQILLCVSCCLHTRFIDWPGGVKLNLWSVCIDFSTRRSSRVQSWKQGFKLDQPHIPCKWFHSAIKIWTRLHVDGYKALRLVRCRRWRWASDMNLLGHSVLYYWNLEWIFKKSSGLNLPIDFLLRWGTDFQHPRT